MKAGSGQERVQRKRAPLAPLSFLIICVAIILAMTVFFRVAGVEVSGNRIYTAEQIVEASGIEEGDNLFFIDRLATVSRLKARLPYVENAVIRRTLPNRLEIEISESAAIAAVDAGYGKWAIDRGCKLLSQVTNDEAAVLVQVVGLEAVSPSTGETLQTADGENLRVAYLTAILKQISVLGLSDVIKEVDMTDLTNARMQYLDRFQVRLGTDENLEYKFQLLKSAVDKMLPGDYGILDLSIDQRAHLIHE